MYLPVVPILVQGRRMHALLDTGSTSSLISRDLVNRLGASGRSFVSEFQTVNGSRRVLTESIDLQVSPLSSSELYDLGGLLVVAGIPAEAPVDQLHFNDFPHLAGLPLSRFSDLSTVNLLIGLDHPELLQPLEVRGSQDGAKQPYPCRTALGWTVQGPLREHANRAVKINALSMSEVESSLQRLWELEDNDDECLAPSMLDNEVMNFWQREVTFSDGHYVVPVPWKQGCPNFPDNRYLAEKRLEGTLKKIERHNQVREYAAGMAEMLAKGFAEPVPRGELKLSPGKVWCCLTSGEKEAGDRVRLCSHAERCVPQQLTFSGP